jgi:hypothetical protein
MPGFDPKCAWCIIDRKAIVTWRLKGGEMPKKTCVTEHRSLCKKCKEPHEGKSSGLCDACYTKDPKPRIKHFNPLDLVRGKGAKRVI